MAEQQVPVTATALINFGSMYDYVDTTLSSVAPYPNQYGVTNTLYPGWCVDRDTTIYVPLYYSSELFDPYYFSENWVDALPTTPPFPPIYPDRWSTIPWNIITYIVNNKTVYQGLGYSAMQVQDVIWFYTNGQVLTTEELNLKNLIEQNYPSDYDPYTDKVRLMVTFAGLNFNNTIAQLTAFEVTNTPNVTIKKFYDYNLNGVKDNGEEYLSGWKFRIGNTVTSKEYFTDDTGSFSTFLPPGNYTITEILPTGNWINTTGETKSEDILLDQSSVSQTFEFGNVCLGAGGGHTPGFWSNKNGQLIITGKSNGTSIINPYLSALNALYLVNRDGNRITVDKYSSFKQWLLNADAVNMSYKLSTHLAAMQLSVSYGSVNENAMIYAPYLLLYKDRVPALSDLMFISVNDLIAAANLAIMATPKALQNSPDRSFLEALYKTLEATNNNNNFVKSTPCSVNYL